MEKKFGVKATKFGGGVVNSNDKVDMVHAMKEYKGVEVYLHAFSTTTKNGCVQHHVPAALSPVTTE